MKRRTYPLEGFAGRLRELWLGSGMSQKEAARQIGTSRSTFAAYLYDGVMPNALYLARLCTVFHVSADYLLFGKQEYDRDKERDDRDGKEKRGQRPGGIP